MSFAVQYELIEKEAYGRPHGQVVGRVRERLNAYIPPRGETGNSMTYLQNRAKGYTFITVFLVFTGKYFCS